MYLGGHRHKAVRKEPVDGGGGGSFKGEAGGGGQYMRYGGGKVE